jgi:hypothetical protein
MSPGAHQAHFQGLTTRRCSTIIRGIRKDVWSLAAKPIFHLQHCHDLLHEYCHKLPQIAVSFLWLLEGLHVHGCSWLFAEGCRGSCQASLNDAVGGFEPRRLSFYLCS